MRVLGYRWRAVEALFAGAATGAFAVAGLYLCAFMRDEKFLNAPAAVPFVFFAFIFAFVGWIVGLIGFGVPVWWLLHRAGMRGWGAAIAFGAVAGFLAHTGLEALGLHAITPAMDDLFADDPLAPPESWSAYRARIGFAAIGALVALVIWRIAYRSPPEAA